MIDLSTIDPALIQARGEYATINGEYKDLMKGMQALAQKACDQIRHALQDDPASNQFMLASINCDSLASMAVEAAELKEQKEALYMAAWGKN